MKLSLISHLALIGCVLAASVKNLAGCVTNNELLITGTYCGAGESVTFSGSATATTFQQCFTKSGNPVEGVPKKQTESVSIGPLTVNPTTTGCVPFCIPSGPVMATLSCTGSQTAEIVRNATFSNIVIEGSNLPKPVTLNEVSAACSPSVVQQCQT